MIVPEHRLTDVERQLLDMLLAGDHPSLRLLRHQATVLTVQNREYSPVGVDIWLHVPRTELPLESKGLSLDDVVFALKGTTNGGQAIVHVRDGFLQTLTLFNWTADWPENPMLQSASYLVPQGQEGAQVNSDKRDMDNLALVLAA